MGAISVQIEVAESHNVEIQMKAKILKGIMPAATIIEGAIESAEIVGDLDILEVKLKRMKMERVFMRLILMNLQMRMNHRREISSIKTEMIQGSNQKLQMIRNKKTRKSKTERKKMSQKRVKLSLRLLLNSRLGHKLMNQQNKKTHGDRLEKCECI